MNNYTFTKEPVYLSKINPENKTFNQLVLPNEIFAAELKKFGFYREPLAIDDDTKPGYIQLLTNKEVLLAAEQHGWDEINVIMVRGLRPGEILRLINHELWYRRLEYKDRWQLITLLTEHLHHDPDGIEWSHELKQYIKGKNENPDINGQLASLLHIDRESVKKYKRIGYSDPALFDKYDSLSEMEFEIDSRKAVAKNKEFDDLVNKNKITPTYPTVPLPLPSSPDETTISITMRHKGKKINVLLDYSHELASGESVYVSVLPGNNAKMELNITNIDAFTKPVVRSKLSSGLFD